VFLALAILPGRQNGERVVFGRWLLVFLLGRDLSLGIKAAA
jgi:hypothetical protein